MGLALEGIKVVDVSQVAAVPMAGRLLGDLGADVIHVEQPVAGDSCRTFHLGINMRLGLESDFDYIWENYNRNKRGVAIDLSQKRGQEILYKLVEKADVFMTNMRPFELEKYRLEYETLSRSNPRLIYASLTSCGRKGPERDVPGYDATAYWARSGVAHKLGAPLMPPAIAVDGAAFGDNVTGLALAYGIMTALYARERSGLGQEIGLSLFQTAVFHLSFDIAATLFSGQDHYDDAKLLAREDIPNPLVGMYQTKDERWLLSMILQPDRYWSQFCQAIEREDLEHDPRFASFEARIENHAALFHILVEVFLSRTLEEWKGCLRGIPFAPVQNFSEVINDPQARANDFFLPFDHPTYGRIQVIANPVNFSKTPAAIRMPAPQFSQHTEEVLLEYGYTWEDIGQLKEQGVIV